METQITHTTILAWARDVLKDSRLNQLCADELRLLICHTRDAVIAEHKDSPYEQAKEQLWHAAVGKYRQCPCGRVNVFAYPHIDTYDICNHDSCNIRLCVRGCSYATMCKRCENVYCHEHAVERGLDRNDCKRCGAHMCDDCHESFQCAHCDVSGCADCISKHWQIRDNEPVCSTECADRNT